MLNISKREAIKFETIANSFEKPVGTETLDGLKAKIAEIEDADAWCNYTEDTDKYHTTTCQTFLRTSPITI